MRNFALTPLLALAACSLRPYEYDASATDTTGTSTTGGTTAEPTSSTTSTPAEGALDLVHGAVYRNE